MRHPENIESFPLEEEEHLGWWTEGKYNCKTFPVNSLLNVVIEHDSVYDR